MGIKTCLLMGYTGRCTIGFGDNGSEEIQVFLTSYSLSISTNIIKSGAAYKLTDDYDDYPDFKRIGLNVIKDCPNYEISISFELTKNVFDKLINELCKYFHQPLKISLLDEISGYEDNYTFDKCYVNQFSFNVQSGAVAAASLNVVYYKNFIQFSSASYQAIATQSSSLSQIGNVFLPYYNWKVKYPFIDEKSNGDKKNLKGFSFSFSHQITPKYSCCTSSSFSKIALAPSKIVFSIPSMTYQLTYIYYDLFNNFNDSEMANNVFNVKDKQKLTIKYKQDENNKQGVEEYLKTIVFTDCYPDTYTPNLANGNDVNSVAISGTIYGGVSYGDDDSE